MNTYYVSPRGADTNDGLTPNTPLKTPQLASDRTQPGDTVYFMGGLYEHNSGIMLRITHSGREDAYITYAGYPGEKPVIQSGNNVWDTIFIMASYIVIDGFTMVGLNDEITLAEGQENYLRYIRKQDTGEDYDDAQMARTNTNAIVVNGRMATARGEKQPHHIIVRNCDISKFPQAGIATMDADYVTIENNRIHDNMYYSLFGSSGISLLGSVDVDDNTTEYKNIIRNNIVYGNITNVMCQNGRKMSDGNGIIIDYNKNTGHKNKLPYKGRTLIENNLVYGNGGGGIHIFNSSNVDAINNTCFDNGRTPLLETWGNLSVSWSTNVRFVNNIAVAARKNATPIAYGAKNTQVFIVNNLYYNLEAPQSEGRNQVGMLPDSPNIMLNNIWADPCFADAEKLDFHLREASPAVDHGTKTLAPHIDLEGRKRPQGLQIDIGALESPYTGINPSLDNDVDFSAMTSFKPIVEEADAARGTPIMDERIDEIWANTQAFLVGKYTKGHGAHGSARVMWDRNYLYALVEVTDSHLSADSDKPWLQSSVEFFIDEDHSKSADYANDDAHYRVNFRNEVTAGTNADLSRFKTVVWLTEDGYLVKAAIPLRVSKGESGHKIGFDIQINGASTAEDKMGSVCKWSDDKSATFADTSYFGDLLLVDAYLHKESNDETFIKITINGQQIESLNGVAAIHEGHVMIPAWMLEKYFSIKANWLPEKSLLELKQI